MGIRSLINRLKKRNETSDTDPFQEVDYLNLCEKGHHWKKAMFIRPDEFASYQQNPEKFQSSNYCGTCGFFPSENLMIKKSFRLALLEMEIQAKTEKKRINNIEELKVGFLENYLSIAKYPEKEAQIFREGYRLYDHFVSELPKMLQELENQKKFEEGSKYK